MKQGEREPLSSEHGTVYHAASWCQAALLSLTPRRLHGLERACLVEGEKTGGFACPPQAFLRSLERVEVLRCFKGRRNIWRVRCEHGEDDTYPNVGEGTYSDTMTFAFCAFALIVGSSPGFLQCALPGKLVQRVAQRFDASQ